MHKIKPTPITNLRRRQKQAGLVRVEVNVAKSDAPLVREMAAALRDPQLAASTRALLRQSLGDVGAKGFKAFLLSAPLDGLDFERPRDFGRDVEF